MNWEEWFKLLLSGVCFAGFSVLGFIIQAIRGEIKSIWAQVGRREDELNKLAIRISAEYVTKAELREIKREIKDEMEVGFNRIMEQIRLMSGKD